MTLPPDNDDPRIVEPPFDPETDTKPLKPLRPTTAAPPNISLRVRRPPATILHDALPTTRADLSDIAPPETDDTGQMRMIPTVPDPPQWRLIMVTAGRSTATIGLDVRQSLVIGRLDPDAIGSEVLGLDLSHYSAQEQGVSRQHAVLIPTADALCLVDLDSTNGTWVNGNYLSPGDRYALVPGDRLELGLLRLIVKSVTPYTRAAG